MITPGPYTSDNFAYPSICGGAEIVVSKDVPIRQEDADYICKSLRDRDVTREAIDRIGANIGGAMTALEMQTIALECINNLRNL